jgi:hypothetical protein
MTCPGGCKNGFCDPTACPDADGDGFCDSFDLCPHQADFKDGVYCSTYNCQSDADCPPRAGNNYYCQKIGMDGNPQCLGVGTCVKIYPEYPCQWDQNPVCGCNGKDFANACQAAGAGVNAAVHGFCSGSQCNPLDSCKRTDLYCASSGLKTIGFCQPVPTSCPPGGSKVCGFDGKTYDNECQANMAGFAVKKPGPC